MNGRRVPWWPLLLIGAPAAVAVWSGWVGLGEMSGFGPVRVLPGISGVTINTAITLPVGVEAYAAYALRAWLTPGTGGAARRYARRSAIGALILGCIGQVSYHLLAAGGAQRAPWPVVVAVAVMPIVTLGFGSGLVHHLRAGENVQPDPSEDHPEPSTPGEIPSGDGALHLDNVSAARAWYEATVALGNPATANALQERFSLSRRQVTEIRREVAAAANGHTRELAEGDATDGTVLQQKQA